MARTWDRLASEPEISRSSGPSLRVISTTSRAPVATSPSPAGGTDTGWSETRVSPVGAANSREERCQARRTFSDTRNLAVGDVTSAEAYCVATTLNISRGSVYYLAWPVRRRISRPYLASYPSGLGDSLPHVSFGASNSPIPKIEIALNVHR